jgi:hypothetical protein
MNAILRTCAVSIAVLCAGASIAGAAEGQSIYVCADDAAMSSRVQKLLPEREIIDDAAAAPMLVFFGRPGGQAEACAREVPGFLDVLNLITGEAGHGTVDDFPRDPKAPPLSDTTQMMRWDTESADAPRWFVDICFLPVEEPCPGDDGPEVLRDVLHETN